MNVFESFADLYEMFTFTVVICLFIVNLCHSS